MTKRLLFLSPFQLGAIPESVQRLRRIRQQVVFIPRNVHHAGPVKIINRSTEHYGVGDIPRAGLKASRRRRVSRWVGKDWANLVQKRNCERPPKPFATSFAAP